MTNQRERKCVAERINLSNARLIACAVSVMLVATTAQAIDAYASNSYTQDEYWEDQLHTYGQAVSWEIGAGASYVGTSSTVIGLSGASPHTGTHTARDFTGRYWSETFDPALWRPSTSGHLDTTASIRAGVNGGSATTVSMAWRTRTDIEVDSRGYPTDGIQMPPMAYDSYGMISDVFDLNGVAGAYVLEVSYDEDSRVITNTGWGYTEEGMAALGFIYLGWFEDTPGGGAIPTVCEWVNAVDGNSTTGSGAVTNYLGSYDDFIAEYTDAATDLSKYLGSWGVDTTGDTVWAYLDHNSEFGSVPEPATIGMLALGFLVLQRRKR